MPAASTILELNLSLFSRIPRPDPDVFAPIHDVIGCPKIFDSEFASHMAERAAKQSEYIGSRLRQLRKQRRLTQAQVADAAKIEPANLSRIENGHFDVSTSTLWKVLAAMGYSPADLAVDETEGAKSNREWATS